MKSSLRASVAAALFLLVLPAAAGQSLRLFPLPGRSPVLMNGAVTVQGGTVTVSLSEGRFSDPRRTWVHRGTTSTPFTEFPAIPGVEVVALSADGQAFAGGDATSRAVQGTVGGDVAVIGKLNASSIALDVSADGSVAVGRSQDAVPGAGSFAWRWINQAGAPLAVLPQTVGSTAWACTSDGATIVGALRVSGDFFQTFPARWVGDSVTTMPVPAAADDASAVDITPDGGVTLINGFKAGQPVGAWLWTSGGGLELLDSRLEGIALSADGNRVLGTFRPTPGVVEPAVWQRGVGVKTVATLAAEAGLILDDYRLGSAFDFSADGTTILCSASLRKVPPASPPWLGLLLDLEGELPVAAPLLEFAPHTKPTRTSRNPFVLAVQTFNVDTATVSYRGRTRAVRVEPGWWRTKVALRPGANLIRVTATGPGGTRTRAIAVRYRPRR